MAVTAPAIGVHVFVRLKLRLLVNGLRDHTARIVLFVFSTLFGAMMAFLVGAGLSLPGLGHSTRGAELALPLGGALLVLGWLVLPLVFFGVDESLDPANFALLPLPRHRLIAGLFTAALVGVPALMTLGATMGMVITAGLLGGMGATLVEVLGICCGLLLCVAGARALTSAFATALRSRRSRDRATVMLALVAGLLGPIQLFVLTGAQHTDWNRATGFAEVVGWTPFGAPYTLGLEVASGRLWAVPVKLVIVLAAIGALLWWWSRTIEQAMLGASSGTSRRSVSNRTPVDGLMFRWLPRTTFGALVARETRYWWRENRRRAGLLSIAIASVVLPISLSFVGAKPTVTITLIGAFAATALANQFGYDGSAYAANVVAGVPGRLEVQSRATAHAIFLMPLLALIAVVSGFASHHPAEIAGQLGLLIAGYGAGLGLVLPLSVRSAFALPESTNPFAVSSGGGSAKGLLAFAVLFGALIASAPLQIAAYFLGPIWLWVGLPIGIAYAAAAYLIGSGAAGDMLDKRMPEVLAAVTARG